MQATIGGKQFKIRPLLRGEIKKLKTDHGISLEQVADLDPGEQLHDALDKIFDVAVNTGDPDKLTMEQSLELYVKVIECSYGRGQTKKKPKSPRRSSSKKKRS